MRSLHEPWDSAGSRSRTGSCSRPSRASGTGSCASRPSATAPASRSRRWCPATPSTTATARRWRAARRAPRRAGGGPVAIQLFGQDPEIMRSAAAVAAARGADLIDLNMGCPVPKVMKTGAGAALINDPDTAVAVASAAREGSGLPVTVKLRASLKQGGIEGLEVAHRLVDEAGVAGLTFHPRSAAVRHKGTPDYELAPAGGGALRPGDRVRRHGRRRAHPSGVRSHWLRGGDARPRRARQPVAVRPGPGHARDRPSRDEIARRMALGRRPRGRAPWPGAGRALPAQVPSLVRRAARGAARRSRTRSSRPTTSPRQRG